MALIDDRFLTNNAIDFAMHYPKLANILTRHNTAVVIGQSGINRKGSGCDLTEQDLFNGFTFKNGFTYLFKAGTYTTDTLNSKFFDYESNSTTIAVEKGVKFIGTDNQTPIKISEVISTFPQTGNVAVLGDGITVDVPSGGLNAFLTVNNITNFTDNPLIVLLVDNLNHLPQRVSTFIGEIAAIPNDTTITMRFPYRNWWSAISQLIQAVGIAIPKQNVTIKNIDTGITFGALYQSDIDIITSISNITMNKNTGNMVNGKLKIKYKQDWATNNLLLIAPGSFTGGGVGGYNSEIEFTSENYNATGGTYELDVVAIGSKLSINNINSNVSYVLSFISGCDVRYNFQNGAAKNYLGVSQSLKCLFAENSKMELFGGLGVGNLNITARECLINAFWNSGGTAGTITISNLGADASTNVISITETF